jgi:hypothetical protein
MFIAKQIFDEYSINYISHHDLPYNSSSYLIRQPSKQTNKIKDIDNPVSDYHRWVNNMNSYEYPRDKLISNLYQINYNFIEEDKKINIDSLFNTDKSESKYVTDIVPEIAPLPIILSFSERIDKMFILLTKLNWCDVDERCITYNVLNRINCDELKQLIPDMIKIADELFDSVNTKTGALDDMEETDKYNFLFHVIAKGHQFYFSSITDPIFCTYLFPDQYGLLCSFIIKKFRVNSIKELC